jgi:GH15 family glucan-1,4-alpha-glucosidase
MSPRIEGYALPGDTQTAALVGADGSIDRLCLPRFDSAASFGAVLGDDGRWWLGPYGQTHATRRRYRGESLVHETDFDTAEGSIRLVDFMPPRSQTPAIVRLVAGVRGRVRMQMELTVRPDRGEVRPRLRRVDGAIGGPDGVWLRTPVETRDHGSAVQADFFVTAGELVPFVLSRQPSIDAAPAPLEPLRALADTESYWAERASSSSCSQPVAAE